MKLPSFEPTANAIKLIAVTAMLFDHIAWLFIGIESPAGFLMRFAGRITAPVMCFFISEGYLHTRNLRRYALRLTVFAAVSYLPYILCSTGALPTLRTAFDFNIIYTLFFSLLTLYAWDKPACAGEKIVLLAVIFLFSTLGDWSYFAPLFTLAFFLGRGNFSRQARYFSCAACLWLLYTALTAFPVFGGSAENTQEAFLILCMQAGVFVSLPLLSLYQGKRGGGKYSGWLFYFFYPFHLLILFFVVRLGR